MLSPHEFSAATQTVIGVGAVKPMTLRSAHCSHTSFSGPP
jgi:hypothetical protein